MYHQTRSLDIFRGSLTPSLNIMNGYNTPRLQSGSEVTDFQESISEDLKATTSFLEAAPIVMGTSSQSTTTLSTYVEQLADIKSFLNKPQLLTSGQWTTSGTLNTNLANGSVESYLSSVTIWANKLAGFNLIRGDFVVRVEINSSPFQQGKLLLHYLPCYSDFISVNPKFGSRTNKWLIQKVQHPHVEMDCRKTSVALKIPYVAPSHYHGLKEGKYDWGTWFLDIFSALSTGTAAPSGQQYVDYLIYGYWENVELVAPIIPQSGKSVRRRNVVPETAENKGPIEDGLRKVGKAAGTLHDIPVLSELASGVAWASDIAANFAHVWGWSKPRELEGVSVFSNQTARYAGTTDGPSLAIPGGAMATNRLKLIDYGSYTNEDEMALSYLLKIPTYMGEVTWAYNSGQGTNLYSLPLTLTSLSKNYVDTVGSHSTSYLQGGTMWYLSRFFQFWRGSINITLKFVKTQMHSGRLQITWTPCTNVTTNPTINNSAYALRTIVDIRTEDEITLNLPYLAYLDYLTNTQYAGQIDVIVLNDLRAPESCAQSIAMQIFYNAGDDFELAVPSNFQGSGYIVPYIPQSGSTVRMHGEESGNEIANQVIAQTSKIDDTTFHSERCIGERILSIKQLIMRNNPITQTNSNTPWGFGQTEIYPTFLGANQMNSSTGALTTCDLGGDGLSWFAPMFAFYRGSVNLLLRDGPGGTALNQAFFGNFPQLTAGVTYTTQPYLSTNSVTNGNVAYGTSLVGPYTWPTCPANFMADNSTCYQHIPYYNTLPITPTFQWNGQDVISDPSLPVSNFVANKLNGWLEPVLQRAAGDDFQLMFFIGVPPVIYQYS